MKKRRWIAMMVGLLLTMSFSGVAMAKNPDSVLRKMGFSKEQMAQLTPEFKAWLAEEKGPRWNLKEMTTEVGPLGSGGSSGGDISIQTIPGSQFTISMVILQDSTPPPNEERYSASGNWTWSIDPYWALTDKIGLAWSGPFQADQSTLVSMYQVSSPSCMLGFQETIPVDQTPGSGFGFDIDILESYGACTGLDQHSGWISGEIYKTTNTAEAHAATIVTKYYHQQVCWNGGSLTFSKAGPSIGITAGTCYDPSVSPGANFTYHGT